MQLSRLITVPSIYLVHNILQVNMYTLKNRMGLLLNSELFCGLVIRLCLEGSFMHVGVHGNDLTLTWIATDILFEPLANTIPHVECFVQFVKRLTWKGYLIIAQTGCK